MTSSMICGRTYESMMCPRSSTVSENIAMRLELVERGDVRVVVLRGAQRVWIEVDGLQPRGASAGDVVALGIADVGGALRRRRRAARGRGENLGGGFGDADDRGVDDRQHGHAQSFADLADLTAFELLLDRTVGIAHDRQLARAAGEPAQGFDRAAHGLAPQLQVRRREQRLQARNGARLDRRRRRPAIGRRRPGRRPVRPARPSAVSRARTPW